MFVFWGVEGGGNCVVVWCPLYLRADLSTNVRINQPTIITITPTPPSQKKTHTHKTDNDREELRLQKEVVGCSFAPRLVTDDFNKYALSFLFSLFSFSLCLWSCVPCRCLCIYDDQEERTDGR